MLLGLGSIFIAMAILILAKLGFIGGFMFILWLIFMLLELLFIEDEDIPADMFIPFIFIVFSQYYMLYA
jgi:hypothetical protein